MNVNDTARPMAAGVSRLSRVIPTIDVFPVGASLLAKLLKLERPVREQARSYISVCNEYFKVFLNLPA